MMIFGGGRILFIFCAFVFALQYSTSNAFYLNNNGYDVGFKDDDGCNECVGYICIMENGEIIEGKDCLKNVVKFCGISKLDESMLKNVVQYQVYEYKSETYLIYSCQDKIGVNDEIEDEDYMDVNMDVNIDQWFDENYVYAERCVDDVEVSKYDKVSDHKKYVENRTKCILEFTERIFFKPMREVINATKNVKMAAENVLKAVNYAKKANEIMKDGEYFKKKADEIAKKAENGSTGLSDVDELLKNMSEGLFTAEKDCGDFKETVKACLNETVNCNIMKYYDISLHCEFSMESIVGDTSNNYEKAKELMVLINEIKPEAEKVLMEANVVLTAQNVQQLAEEAKEAAANATKIGEEAKKEAKRIGEEAKKEAKESKEIGENSNKTANFAIEIGMEAKMTANESMKIGNEANQKVLEVEKLAKDSMKLAETNEKEGDKTVAEIQKLKSNGEKIGCKFGIFVISLFAFIFLA